MRQTLLPTRSATIAIAAMLALGSTSALAQDATAPTSDPITILPVPMVDPVVPAAQPQPQPRTAPQPAPVTVSQPVVQSVPVAPEPVFEEAVVETPPPVPASASAPRRTTPQAPTASAQPVPAGGKLAVTETPPDKAALAAPAPLPVSENELSAPVSQASDGFDWSGLAALAIAGLIPIGLIALALLWWRRRARRVETAPVEREHKPAMAAATTIPIERPADKRTVAPVVDTKPPIPVEIATPLRAAAPPAAHQEPATPLTTGGTVILPRKLPPSFEERDALLRRMVEAKPDRANPFRSPRARVRRARLILQSLGREFKRAAPRFDLSQYSYLWPHLADANAHRHAA